MKTAIQTSPSLNSYMTQLEDNIRPLALSLNPSTSSSLQQNQQPSINNINLTSHKINNHNRNHIESSKFYISTSKSTSGNNNNTPSPSPKIKPKHITTSNRKQLQLLQQQQLQQIQLQQPTCSQNITNLVVNNENNILIIDFDNKSRELLDIWLRSEGFHVTSAKNRVEAISLLDCNRYELILYDTDSKIENIESHTHSQIFYIVNKMEYSQFQQKSINKLEFQSKPLSKGNLLSHITYILENRLKSFKIKEYEQIVKEKEDEIISLKSHVGQLKMDNAKIHKAMEPPIEAITNSLNEILTNKALSNSPIKKELETILYQITTNSDLYGPAVEKLMNQDINPIAKSILKTYSANITESESSPAIKSRVVEIETIDIEPLKVWGFNPYLYTPEQLIGMLHRIFVYYQLPEKLKINEVKLNGFLYHIKSMYHDHPYHNFYHAFDVTQTLFSYLTTFGLSQYLTHLDIITLLLCGLCHDLNHPGLNNAFLVSTFDTIAIQFNDRSVLENHHLSLMWKALDQFNMLSALSKEEVKEFRQCAITSIISTDMSLHFPLVNRMKQRLAEIKLNGMKTLDDTLQDRLFLIEVLLHAADISNIAKPWDVSKIWCNRINVESFVQGRMEQIKGIPVTDWMDETKTSVEKNSLNFMLYIGNSFYELIAELFPQTRVCVDNLKSNIIGWTKVCEDNKHEPHSKTKHINNEYYLKKNINHNNNTPTINISISDDDTDNNK